MKKLLLLIVMIATVSICLGCKGSKGKTIIMGTNAEFPPFEYRDGDEVIGFDVEIANLIAEDLNADLKIVDMSFDGLIPALQSKKIDFIAAGMSVTKERKKNVNFSNGYYKASQVIIVRKDDNTIKGKKDLVGKKLGVQLGTTGDTEAQKIKKATLKKYNAGFAAVMDLKNQKLDAVVLDYEPAHNFAKQNSDIKVLKQNLTQESYAIAVSKGDKKLLESINATLKKIRENGQYDELVSKYFNK